MAGPNANVANLEALTRFHASVIDFQHDLRDALTTLSLQTRRALDWIESDRTRYWPQAAREASDKVSEARIALERKELTLPSEDKPSAIQEKKAFEKAKRRLRLCEEKIQLARSWAVKARQEADDFQGALVKLTGFADADVPRALAALERMIEALDRYATLQAPPTGDGLKQAAAALNQSADRKRSGGGDRKG